MNIVDATDREEWDDFIKSHREANFLQSWDFYEFHKKRGKRIVRRLALDDKTIIGAYAGVVETAKRGTYMAIAGGPIVDWGKRMVVNRIFDDIKEQGRQKDIC